MSDLPKKIGPITLMRRLGGDGATESYAGILDEPAGKAVHVRRVLPVVMADHRLSRAVRERVGDLTAIRHNALAPVHSAQEIQGELYVVSEAVDGISLSAVLAWCRANDTPLPHNIYLNLATQICNGLEALHGRPGKTSGAQHILHLGLSPDAITIDRTGRAIVGEYGLLRSPTAVPSASTQSTPPGVEYLSPEQTQPDADLAPASDVFALGALLYELLTLQSLFAADSGLQTIHKVRRADVTGALAHVRDLLPGLDRVLQRALSLNPRHRYQRAFVLREDLRGLMAGYSFSNINDHTVSYLGDLFDSAPGAAHGALMPSRPGTTPNDTASFIKAAAGGQPGQSTLVPEEDELSSLIDDAAAGNQTINLDDDTGWIPNPQLQGFASEEDEPPTDVPTVPPAAGSARSLISRRKTPLPMHASTPSLPPEPPGSGSVELDETTGTGWIPNPKASQKAAPAPPKPPTPAPPQPRAQEPAPPPPEPAPAPVHTDTDLDDDWEPEPVSGGNGMLIAVGAGVVTLVALIVCAGGGGGVFIAGMFATSGSTSAPSVADMVDDSPDADDSPEVEAPPKAEASDTPDDKPDDEPEGKPTSGGDASNTASASGSRAGSGSTPRPEPSNAAVASTNDWSAPRPRDPEPTYSQPSYDEPSYDEPAYEDDGAAYIEPESKGRIDDIAPPPVEGTADASASAGMEFSGDLNALAERGEAGSLTPADRQQLEGWSDADVDYTRAKVILYQDAKVRSDHRGRARYMSELMAVPENRYNPTLLVEDAELYIRKKDYDMALQQANLAERHWARLPSELIFSRKAMIYEIQASSWQGKYYNSGGEDMNSLDNAIRGWERFRRHAETKNRADLTVKADAQLKRLNDMKRRVGG